MVFKLTEAKYANFTYVVIINKRLYQIHVKPINGSCERLAK